MKIVDHVILWLIQHSLRLKCLTAPPRASRHWISEFSQKRTKLSNSKFVWCGRHTPTHLSIVAFVTNLYLFECVRGYVEGILANIVHTSAWNGTHWQLNTEKQTKSFYGSNRVCVTSSFHYLVILIWFLFIYFLLFMFIIFRIHFVKKFYGSFNNHSTLKIFSRSENIGQNTRTTRKKRKKIKRLPSVCLCKHATVGEASDLL